ncbi:MAG: PKD domain-containing protein [bacterium]|nr:PKD domain-containing protein [bacterium]
MLQHVTRILVIAIILMLIGCSGGGSSPTTPPVDQNPNPGINTDPGTNQETVTGRILGNFYYTSDENNELLAWGTIVDTSEGWDFRIDYMAPKLKALERAESERQSQMGFNLTWLNLIKCNVKYTNADLDSTGFPTYEPGDLMIYEVNLASNLPVTLKKLCASATQVDQHSHPLAPDAMDTWYNFQIPYSGITLNGDWSIPGTLADGKYFTKIIVGYPIFGGWLSIIIFDDLAGSFKVGGLVYYDPVAKGVTTTPTVIVGETVHVQDNGSYDPDGGTIDNYEWDVNEDGITDYTGTSADFTYSTTGTKYINLTVTDNEGAKDDLTDDPGDALIEVNVIPPPVPPVAVGTASKYEAYTGEDITFDGTGSYDPNGGSIVLYEWDFDGDGIFEVYDAPTIAHSFDTPGVYMVDLRVTNDALLSDTLGLPTDERLEITINAAPQEPTACYTYEPDIAIPCQDITFDASCSTDPDGDIVSYEWDINCDGTIEFTSDSPIAVFPYTQVGDFCVRLVVTDSTGLTGEFEDTVSWVNALPTAVATADLYEVEVGQDVHFSGTDSHDNDCDGESIAGFEWDFDYIGTFNADASGENVTHSYTDPGTYYVQLQVTDDEGDTVMLDNALEIAVNEPSEPPHACATWSVYGGGDPDVCEMVFFDASCSTGDCNISEYAWDWDNDGTYDEFTTTPDAVHSFDTIDSHQIQCRVTCTDGQTDTLDTPLEITVNNVLPTAVIDVNKTDVKVGETVEFDGSMSHDNDCDNMEIVDYRWDLDGDEVFESNGETVDHYYSTAGDYTVTLEVEDDEGGTAQDQVDIHVSDTTGPTACFTVVTEYPIVCEQVFFDGSCSTAGDAPISQYDWDFDGDGTYDFNGTSPDSVWSFFDIGDIDITLRVTDTNGLTDTYIGQVSIGDLDPVAVPDQTVYYVDECDTVEFDGTGSYDQDCDGDIIISYDWDLNGDGTYESTGPNPSYEYNTPGIVDGDLMVTDNEGSTATTGFSIEVSDTMPTAVAIVDATEIDVCDSVDFSASGSYDGLCGNGGIALYEWDFEGDGNWVVDSSTPSYSFEYVGNFTPSCRVTDGEGNTDEVDLPTITVNNVLPTAVIAADKTDVQVDEVINFDGSGSLDNDCDGAEISMYEWNFQGDGMYWVDAGPNTTHSYSVFGTYYPQLRVTDDEGGIDTDSMEINVTSITGPTACFEGPVPDPVVCAEFTLDASCSTEGDAPIVNYDWDFDGDGTADYSSASPIASWTFSETGDHDIWLQVTDSNGYSDDAIGTVTVVDLDPVAVPDQTVYYVGECGTANFDGTGSYDQDCSGDFIVSYDWDLDGNGTYETTGPTPSWEYNDPDTVNGSLMVTDNEGSTDSTAFTVEVSDTTPTAVATVDITEIDVCGDVNFDASESYDGLCGNGGIALYEWDFEGDGNWVVDSSTPGYSYDDVGNRIPSCRVTDNKGNTDEVDLPSITVSNVLPTAVATADKTNAKIGESIFFDGSNSHDNDCDNMEIVEYRWDFNDDGTWDAYDINVEFAFDYAGDYTVTLEVQDDEDGTAQDTVDVHISDLTGPTACFITPADDPIVCEQFFLDASCSTAGDSPISNYDWDFDNDGTYDYFGTTSDTVWTYDTVGDHSITLRVTDTNGLTDTVNNTVTVVDLDPVAVPDQTVYYVDECDTVEFDGTGSYDQDCSGDFIVSYDWDLDGDGTYETTGPSPSWEYNDPETVNGSLMVTDNEGSTDTVSFDVEIADTAPTAVATVDKTAVNVCEEVNFDASESYDGLCGNGGIALYEWDFEGDGTWIVDDSKVKYSYDGMGNRIPSCRVTDNEGNTDEVDLSMITVGQNDPTAYGVADKYDVIIGESVEFDGTGSTDNDCDGNYIADYEWDVDGDGTYDLSGDIVSYSYSAPGDYAPKLRVTDDEGAQDTYTLDTIHVGTVPPIAKATFIPSTTNPTECMSIEFMDDGSYDPDGGLIVSYEWDWNNDGTYDESGTDVFHTFNTPDNYTVGFMVTDDDGEVGTTSLSVTVTDTTPTAVSTVDKTEGTTDDTFNFDGSSSTDGDCGLAGLTLDWDADWDGLTFTVDHTGTTMAISYDAPGEYDVLLRATDNEGNIVYATPIHITVTLTGCAQGIHMFNIFDPASTRSLVAGYSNIAFSIVPRADIAYFEAGVFKGHGIVQGGYHSLTRFNPNADSNNPIDDNIYTVKTGGPETGTVIVTSLDASPLDSYVAVVTSDEPGTIRLVDATMLAGNPVLYTYNIGASAKIMAADFNSNGDLWIVAKTSDTANVNIWHGNYVGAPSYYNNWVHYDINTYTGNEYDIFDIAIDITDQLLYIFDAGPDGLGRVQGFNIATLANVVTVGSLFTNLDYESSSAYGYAIYGDIEIDHVSPNEDCHIIIYGRTSTTTAEIHKYDKTMSLIDTAYYGGTVWPSMTINPAANISDRDLMCPGQDALGFWFADYYE